MSGFISSHFPTVPFKTFYGSSGLAGILGNKHADSLSKAGNSLPTAMVSFSLPQLLQKVVKPRVTNAAVTFPHFPSHLNCPIPTVSPLVLVLSRPECFEISAFASKVKASYNCLKSVLWKTLPSALWTPSTGPLSSLSWLCCLYANLSLALQSPPWRAAQLLGVCEVPLLIYPSERIG